MARFYQKKQRGTDNNAAYEENDKITKVLKVQIYPTDEQCELLNRTMTQFMLACDYLSSHAFYDGAFSEKHIHESYYYTVRDLTKLPAQMANSACQVVASAYKTVKAQMEASPAHYRFIDENGNKQSLSFNRDLRWLCHPIHFHTPQLLLQRERDWCFKTNGSIDLLSINTIEGRTLIPFNKTLLPDYRTSEWSFGSGRIIHHGRYWFFYISVNKPIRESIATSDVTHVVGIDRGLVNMYYTFDSNGAIDNMSGAELQQRRDKYSATRRSLQHKGTKGAKRVLKRISGRENRWMHDVNHCASKTLVSKYCKGTLLAFEDLANVSFAEENLHGGNSSYSLRSWSFFEFEQMVRYKAKEKGVLVTSVNPEYTSQRCPACGTICKEFRNRASHLYSCKSCGFSANDDLVGAMNIWLLGTQYASGIENPHFEK